MSVEKTGFGTYNKSLASSPTTRAIGAEDGALVHLAGAYKAVIDNEMLVRLMLLSSGRGGVMGDFCGEESTGSGGMESSREL